jgi:hypothetical protein
MLKIFNQAYNVDCFIKDVDLPDNVDCVVDDVAVEGIAVDALLAQLTWTISCVPLFIDKSDW